MTCGSTENGKRFVRRRLCVNGTSSFAELRLISFPRRHLLFQNSQRGPTARHNGAPRRRRYPSAPFRPADGVGAAIGLCLFFSTRGLRPAASGRACLGATRPFVPSTPAPIPGLLQMRIPGLLSFSSRQHPRFKCVCIPCRAPVSGLGTDVYANRSSCIRAYRATVASDGLIWPRSAEASNRHPQRPPPTFFPCRKWRHSLRKTKKLASRRPPLRSSRKRCGALRPRLNDRHRGCGGRGPDKR